MPERQRQQSPNWERYQGEETPIEDTYPFDEGFPHFIYREGAMIMFTVVTRDGQRHEAFVDPSKQYYAEGLEWRTYPAKESLVRSVVVAWSERENVEVSEETAQ